MRSVTLAVLAGGEGSRMGRAKATLEVRGTPILHYLLDRWEWPGPTMLVTAPGREKPPGSERFTREVVDPIVGAGPLRGLVTAAEACATETLIVATCDMPLVGRGQFGWLAARLGDQPQRIGVMTRNRGGEIEPFPMALRASARSLLAQRLEDGVRSVRLLAEVDAFQLLAPPHDWPRQIWANLNHPEDVTRFLAMKTNDL